MVETHKNRIKSIKPIAWLGPDVYLVESDEGLSALVRQDHHGWHAWSSPDKVYEGGALVAGDKADLLEAAGNALALANTPIELQHLERQRLNARKGAAKRWKLYIERGVSGTGAIGTESTGENFIVGLASTLLPCGMPALSLLDRFTIREIEAIHDAMQEMGMDGWNYPLIARHSENISTTKP
ncbi:hypothetical protein V1290_005198 [Bradyrhizobium sp. AZCC 1578]|uniref:hypothetical protein n=1 Tax=unclassified Bradyrhizobium TaxID=2631580 RepID=UPI002FF0356E